jgi:endonuclease-3 related protein
MGGGTYARRRETLTAMFAAMRDSLGPSDWWPARSPFEVAVGAVLTQNTAWTNVEKALDNLRARGALHPVPLTALDEAELAEAIRPAGFFRQKGATLRRLLDFLAANGGLTGGASDDSLICFAGRDTESLRGDLLAIRGIGPETADCVLLYALGRPSFVADAYTRRLFHRHALVPDAVSYAELRDFFMEALEPDAIVFNEYQALIVRVGKAFCRKSAPLCTACPLRHFLEYGPD